MEGDKLWLLDQKIEDFQLIVESLQSIIDYNSEVSDLKFSEKPLKVDSDWFVEGNSKNKVWEKD